MAWSEDSEYWWFFGYFIFFLVFFILLLVIPSIYYYKSSDNLSGELPPERFMLRPSRIIELEAIETV